MHSQSAILLTVELDGRVHTITAHLEPVTLAEIANPAATITLEHDVLTGEVVRIDWDRVTEVRTMAPTGTDFGQDLRLSA